MKNQFWIPVSDIEAAESLTKSMVYLLSKTLTNIKLTTHFSNPQINYVVVGIPTNTLVSIREPVDSDDRNSMIHIFDPLLANLIIQQPHIAIKLTQDLLNLQAYIPTTFGQKHAPSDFILTDSVWFSNKMTLEDITAAGFLTPED